MMARAWKDLPLERTRSRARWGEYSALLDAAITHGYRLVSLERWLSAEAPDDGLTFVMRHDVDQDPQSALRTARIDLGMGARATWYFRWRTAHPDVVSVIRDSGFEVGLHYETATRRARELGAAELDQAQLEDCRRELKEEIRMFAAQFGPIRSIAAHGDTRVPTVRNVELLEGERVEDYGVEFDANHSVRGRGLAHWLTDRAVTQGRWKDQVDPNELLARRVSPILLVMHPNNWTSGTRLWVDRVLRRSVPRTVSRPIRSGSDRPIHHVS